MFLIYAKQRGISALLEFHQCCVFIYLEEIVILLSFFSYNIYAKRA